MKTVSILIADDVPVMRHGLRDLLQSQPGWRVIAEACNGREAVEKARELQPDIAILDIGMPEFNGVDACSLIVKEVPTTRVLMQSMYLSDELLESSVKAGAKAFVLKSDAERDLIRAVKALASNSTFFTPTVFEVMLNRSVQTAGRDSAFVLTAREREIIQLVAEGSSNKEIATSLGISKRTVENHRAKIMNKLHLRSLSQLIRYAIRERIVEP